MQTVGMSMKALHMKDFAGHVQLRGAPSRPFAGPPTDWSTLRYFEPTELALSQ